MQYYNEFTVDGKPLLVPDGDVALTFNDLDAASAGRDESGVMHRIRLRKRVRTWEFHYFALTKAEFAYLEGILSDKAVFTFSFPKEDGTRGSCQAYCAQTGLTYENAKLGLYRNYKFQVTQC